VPDDVKQTARAARRPKARTAYKLTLQDAVLPAGHAVCHSRALRERCTGPTSPAPARRARAERDNTALMRELLALRQEEAAAGLRQLRRGVAGAQDGRARPGDAFPARPGRRARPFAERDLADLREFAAQQLGLADLQAWDWPTPARNSRRRATPSATRSQAVLHRAEGAGRPVPIIETLFEVRIRPTARRSGTQVRFYRIERRHGVPDGRAGSSWSASSTWTPTRARQAPRRLDGRRAQPLAAPRHRRAADPGGAPGVQLRCAGGRQARAAHARRRASRCSTSSATACTTC
jgi:hypothetical protein